MDALADFLPIRPTDRVMDLACGKGRHAIYLNSKGFEVTGVDLSSRKIAIASAKANERLHFFIHDMRQPFQPGQYDFVLNLFTSFGYFEKEEENLMAIRAAAENLKHGGVLVLDFFNTYQVLANLPQENVVERAGVAFHTHKYLKDGFVVKEIRFEHEGRSYAFREQVRALTETDFRALFEQAGLEILHLLGNYKLNLFTPAHSDRMIWVVRKLAT